MQHLLFCMLLLWLRNQFRGTQNKVYINFKVPNQLNYSRKTKTEQRRKSQQGTQSLSPQLSEKMVQNKTKSGVSIPLTCRARNKHSVYLCKCAPCNIVLQDEGRGEERGVVAGTEECLGALHGRLSQNGSCHNRGREGAGQKGDGRSDR